ncbi:hypothetical protein SprV_0301193500 [Sparganum proliferum]
MRVSVCASPHTEILAPLAGIGIPVMRPHREHRRMQKVNNPRGNRPELRTAQVARELARYKADVASLSETRANGSTLITEKTQILRRWVEHFKDVLNRPSTISEAAIGRLPQVKTNIDPNLPPSLQETIRAVQQLSNGEAPGSNAIPAEIYKRGGVQLMDHLTALFQEMWRQGEVPQDFKDTTIVHLFRQKDNR